MALIKTDTRLSRKIRKEDGTSWIDQRLIEQGACRIRANTVSAPDIADVAKPYSKKMDHLAGVRNWSTGKKRSARYRTVEVIGTRVDGAERVPLFAEVHSQRAGDFLSENRQIGKDLDGIVSQVGSRGIRLNRSKTLPNVRDGRFFHFLGNVVPDILENI